MQRVSGKQYVKIFSSTFKIGMLTFGGGMAMIPMMEDEYVRRQGWIDEESMLDTMAIAQSLPGVIAVNTSVMVGYHVGGWLGGVCAALGVVLPSFLVLTVVTAFYNQFRTNPYVNAAFSGLSACVAALLVAAVYRMGKKAVVDVPTVLFCLLAMVLLLCTKVGVIWIIVASGILGWSVQYVRRRYRASSGKGE